MPRLHEITGALAALEAELIESGGEWTEAIEAKFAATEGALEEKVDGYAALIREWSLDAEKWKAEAARCAGHQRALEASAERLKKRLCQELVAIGRDKVDGARFKVAVQRAAPSVEVLGLPEQLPEAFRRTVTTVTADKAAIMAAMREAGVSELASDEGHYEIVFARSVAGAPYLRIR